jgi:FixJ family two-component response regulator
MSEETTVFVVDDDASVRRSLTRLLTASGFHVESFESAKHYLAREPVDGPGCLLLDINMPGVSGIELQQRLQERGDTMPIVFLTGHGDIPTSVHAMKEGAHHFLTKPVDVEDLVPVIEDALLRHHEILAGEGERALIVARLDTLTPREREVLEELITGAPNKIVADRLGIAVKTVKVHRAHVMEKMGVRSVAELVQLCHIAEQ